MKWTPGRSRWLVILFVAGTWSTTTAACVLFAAGPDVTFVIGGPLVAEGADTPTPTGLTSPFGIDFLPDGTMYLVELEGGRVHRRTAGGELSLYSGDGSRSYRGDGGPAAEATYDGMHNIAISRSGQLFIADSWNHCIRRIDARTGIVSTFAGDGEAGFRGDGQTADQARFDYLMCVSLDPRETALYVADLKNLRIRRVDLRTRRVSTVAGNGQKGIPADGSIAVEAPLVDPRAVAVDKQGQIYVLERGGQALRRVGTDGRITTVAGDGTRGYRDGTALQAQFGSPKHIAIDDRGRVYIADDQNRAIRQYDPASGKVTTVLGRGVGQPAVQLQKPHGVCVEGDRLYVVDTGNDRVLSIPLPD